MSKLARNTLDLAVNRFCPPVFGFVLLVFVGRESSEFLGWYTVVSVFFFVFQTLPFLGLTPHIVKEAALRPEQAGRIYGAVITIGVANVAVLCACLPGLLHVVGFPVDVRGAIWIALVTAFPYAIAYAAELMCVAFHRTRLLGIVPLIENTLRVVLSIAALQLGYGLRALFLIMLAGRVLAAVVYAGGLNKRVLHGQPVRLDGTTIRAFLRHSPVFLLNTLTFLMVSRAAFFVLSWYVDPVSIAHFSVGYRPLELVTVGLTAFVGAVYPMLARAREESGSRFSDLSFKSLKLCLIAALILGLGGFLCAEAFVLLLFPGQHPEAVPLMRLLVWCMPLVGVRVVTSGILFSSARPRPDLIALVVGSALHLVLLAWWVPAYGVYGAVFAVLLEGAAQMGLRLWFVWGSLRPAMDRGERFVHFVAVSAGCVVACLSLDYLTGSAYLKAGMAVLLAGAYAVTLLRTGALNRDDFDLLGLDGWWRRLRLLHGS